MTDSIFLIGCGAMGGAMAAGWVAQGRGAAMTVVEPVLARVPTGVHAVAAPPADAAPAAVLVLAIKPQLLDAVAPTITHLAGPGTIVVSILAAVETATLRHWFPHSDQPVAPNLLRSTAPVR